MTDDKYYEHFKNTITINRRHYFFLIEVATLSSVKRYAWLGLIGLAETQEISGDR